MKLHNGGDRREAEGFTVDDRLTRLIRKAALSVALQYERATGWKRKLGITAEVGEVLACGVLKLKLATNPRSEGSDAIDSEGKSVQIKSRRSESPGLPRDVGRVGTFSKHRFDYALLVILDREYRLAEIWRTDYDDLAPLIDRQKRRNPTISGFKSNAKLIWPTHVKAIKMSGRADSLRGAVIRSWEKAERPRWNHAQTMSVLEDRDRELEGRGLKPAKQFRAARLQNDREYMHRWMGYSTKSGCKFPWATENLKIGGSPRGTA